jgi:hypothetical protein
VKRNFIYFLLFAISALFFCGCETRWEEHSIDGPWCAPNVHVREKEKTYLPFYSPLPEHTLFWITANGSRVESYKIVDSSVRYLDELGYFDRWPKTRGSYDDYQQRLAPFTFHIVAINPAIVVMVPHDFGNANDGRSISGIRGQQSEQAFGSKYMINLIEYGTSLPYDAKILWFSPDLQVPPTQFIQVSDSEQKIVQKGITLVLTKDGNLWKTSRE